MSNSTKLAIGGIASALGQGIAGYTAGKEKKELKAERAKEATANEAERQANRDERKQRGIERELEQKTKTAEATAAGIAAQAKAAQEAEDRKLTAEDRASNERSRKTAIEQAQKKIEIDQKQLQRDILNDRYASYVKSSEQSDLVALPMDEWVASQSLSKYTQGYQLSQNGMPSKGVAPSEQNGLDYMNLTTDPSNPYVSIKTDKQTGTVTFARKDGSGEQMNGSDIKAQALAINALAPTGSKREKIPPDLTKLAKMLDFYARKEGTYRNLGDPESLVLSDYFRNQQLALIADPVQRQKLFAILPELAKAGKQVTEAKSALEALHENGKLPPLSADKYTAPHTMAQEAIKQRGKVVAKGIQSVRGMTYSPTTPPQPQPQAQAPGIAAAPQAQAGRAGNDVMKQFADAYNRADPAQQYSLLLGPGKQLGITTHIEADALISQFNKTAKARAQRLTFGQVPIPSPSPAMGVTNAPVALPTQSAATNVANRAGRGMQ